MININTEQFNNLSEQERAEVIKILNEYAQNGTSISFDNLLYEDYQEIPVDIETFITDDNYLGKAWKDASGKLKLYPFWLEQLKKLFPNNTDTDYNTLLESGARGIGKAQPLDSLVLTANGYVKMRDIKIGEKVFGCDGKLHNVIGVFPQGVKPTCKVSFNDGTSTLCSDEHLWVVSSRRNHVNHKVVTTKELIEKGLTHTRMYKGNPIEEHIYEIPKCSPIEFEHKDVVIPPYTLGVLLGDGTLTRGRVAFTSYDEEIINNVNSELSDNLIIHRDDKRHYYSIRRMSNKLSNEYGTYIAQSGLNVRAENKHIPQIYLHSDVQTRLNILQGLLDTDGYVSQDGGHISISTASEQLAKDIQFLVQSLGGVCHWHTKDTSYINKKTGERVNCQKAYIVYIRLSKDIIPFRLTRKIDRLNPKRLSPTRYIDSIEYVEPTECQCILVDSDEHLYLTNDFIVTHNTEVAVGVAMAYLMYRVLCLKNPLEFYHLKPTEKIVFAFMNIKKELSKDIAMSKFQKTIQLSPWFMARGSMTQFENQPYWNPPEPIQIIIGSQSDDVIGMPIFSAFFDEISFVRNQDIDKQKKKALDMIDTALGGMRTRFIHEGKNPTLLIVASSKRSEQSFMETYIKTKAETEGDVTLVVDQPVWEVKPKGTYSSITFKVGLGNKFLESIVLPDEADEWEYRAKGYNIINVPIDFKSIFLENINRALCDYAGISSFSSNKYFSGETVAENILDTVQNPMPDLIEVGNAKDDLVQYKDFFDLSKIPSEYKYKPLYIHLDMSVSGDTTGIVGTWIIGKKPTIDGDAGKDLLFRLAFGFSVKAPKGRQISFEKNRNFIRWLREQGFNIGEISADTFQSYDLLQILQSEDFKTSILSVDRVDSESHICKPYQFLKSTIYEHRLQMFRSDRLFTEFVEVERNNSTGKIDHPDGGRKDFLDAVCGSVFIASSHAEEYAYNYGEDLDLAIQTNMRSDTNLTKKQIQMDLDDILKSIRQRQDKVNEQAQTVLVNRNNSLMNDIYFVSQGIVAI